MLKFIKYVDQVVIDAYLEEVSRDDVFMTFVLVTATAAVFTMAAF